MRILNFLLLFIIITCRPLVLMAAACCGGGFSTPSLITGDEKALLTSSLSYSKIDTDVYANGVWQKRSGDDVTRVLKIEAAHIFSDRFQTGFSLPVQTREKSGIEGGSSSGLGDVALQSGYEYLPEWDYNPYRPHGVGFATLTFPTGKSIYESDNANGLDSRGRGFWALGLGTVLNKSWMTARARSVDLSAHFEIHKSFEKTVHSSQFDGVVKPGLGGSLSISSGYNLDNLRLGGSIAWTYEDAIDVASNTSAISSSGSAQRNATGSISSSYLFADNWSGSLSYSDQTLFGTPSNTTLSKSLLFALQKRWSR